MKASGNIAGTWARLPCRIGPPRAAARLRRDPPLRRAASTAAGGPCTHDHVVGHDRAPPLSVTARSLIVRRSRYQDCWQRSPRALGFVMSERQRRPHRSTGPPPGRSRCTSGGSGASSACASAVNRPSASASRASGSGMPTRTPPRDTDARRNAGSARRARDRAARLEFLGDWFLDPDDERRQAADKTRAALRGGRRAAGASHQGRQHHGHGVRAAADRRRIRRAPPTPPATRTRRSSTSSCRTTCR